MGQSFVSSGYQPYPGGNISIESRNDASSLKEWFTPKTPLPCEVPRTGAHSGSRVLNGAHEIGR
eukprot:7943700-Pyramimonas_sp.AAC.1